MGDRSKTESTIKKTTHRDLVEGGGRFSVLSRRCLYMNSVSFGQWAALKARMRSPYMILM